MGYDVLVDKTQLEASLKATANAIRSKTGSLSNIQWSTDGFASAVAEIDGIFVTPQMFGAKGDGSADDTAAIQSALDASDYVYIPDGTYLINGTHQNWGDSNVGGIQPKSNQTILLSDNAVLKAIENTTGFYHVVNIYNVENVYLKGGKVQGIKTTPTNSSYGGEFGHGISVRGSNNVVVEQIEIFDCWGDSVGVGWTSSGNSQNVSILNCLLHDSRRQGISIVGCEHCTIRDCEIYNISGTDPQYGIDIEPDGSVGVAVDITIDNCYIHDNAQGDIVIADVHNQQYPQIKIENVNITNCTLSSINCQGTEVVSGININNCTMEFIYFYGVNPVRISNSTTTQFYLHGGTVYADNCDIINNFAPSDNSSAKGNLVYAVESSRTLANLICSNCRFYTLQAGLAYFLLKSIAKDCVDKLIFNSCEFSMGENYYLMQALEATEVQFNNCDISYRWNAYELFAVRQVSAGYLIIKDSKVSVSSGTPNAILKVYNSSPFDIEIRNCDFPNTKYFLEGNPSKLRAFNNQANNKTINGATNTDVLILNKNEWQTLDIYSGEVS